jgi:translation initiation factor 1 (eIF-1/SUI1)
MNEKVKTIDKTEDKKPVVRQEVPSPPISSLTDMVDRTTERISFLKKKQEDLQKQKADLEDLRRQREELDSVKREVLVNLERGIAVLDKEESELKRKHSLVKITRDEFDRIITEVRGIKEKTWPEENLKGELASALAIVAKAKRGYVEARGKIDALTTPDEKETVSQTISAIAPPESLPESPGELLRRGFFLFLPAALLAILVAIAVRLIYLLK